MNGSAGELIAQWQGRLLKFAALVPQRKLAQLLAAALVLWNMHLLSQLVWAVWPQAAEEQSYLSLAKQNMGGEQQVQAMRPSQSNIDIEALTAAHIFRDPATEAFHDALSEIKEQAQKTALNVELYGIIYSTVTEQARAIIKYPSGQFQHRIGDILKIGSNVTLERILREQVIIRNQGRFESIFLYTDELNQALRERRLPSPGASPQQPVQRPVAQQEAAEKPAEQPGRQPQRVVDQRGNKKSVAIARELQKTLLENPASLAKLASFSPVRTSEGTISGYRVAPRNAEQFTALGFQPGDVIVGVNGVSLGKPENLLEVYKMMRTAKEGTFTVRRNGAEVSIVVGVN